MRVVLVNWTDLETAFERNSPDTESFLDLRSGEVVTVTQGAIDYSEQRNKVQTNGESYLRVEPAASREQYKWMERFVAHVTDDKADLRELVPIALVVTSVVSFIKNDDRGRLPQWSNSLYHAYRIFMHWHRREVRTREREARQKAEDDAR